MERGVTELMNAVDLGDLETVTTLLANGANPDAQNENLNTALIYAVQNENIELVRVLLNYDAEDHQNGFGDTAVIIAARIGNDEIIHELLSADISSDVQNNQGDTALIVAARNENLEIVQELLDTDEIVIDIPNNQGDTALIVATRNGKLEIVRELSEYGADYDIKNNQGDTAVIVAARNGNLEIVQVLLDDSSFDIPNNQGDTALIVAARNGTLDIVKVLIAGGATIDIPNNQGDTALQIAVLGGHVEVVTTLLAAAESSPVTPRITTTVYDLPGDNDNDNDNDNKDNSCLIAVIDFIMYKKTSIDTSIGDDQPINLNVIFRVLQAKKDHKIINKILEYGADPAQLTPASYSTPGLTILMFAMISYASLVKKEYTNSSAVLQRLIIDQDIHYTGPNGSAFDMSVSTKAYATFAHLFLGKHLDLNIQRTPVTMDKWYEVCHSKNVITQDMWEEDDLTNNVVYITWVLTDTVSKTECYNLEDIVRLMENIDTLMVEWVPTDRVNNNSEVDQSVGWGYTPSDNTDGKIYLKLVPFDLYVTITSIAKMFKSKSRHFRANKTGEQVRIGNLYGARGSSEIHGQGPPFPDIYVLSEDSTEPERSIPEEDSPALLLLQQQARAAAASNEARIQHSRQLQSSGLLSVPDTVPENPIEIANGELQPLVSTEQINTIVNEAMNNNDVDKLLNMFSPGTHNIEEKIYTNTNELNAELYTVLELAVVKQNAFMFKNLLYMGATPGGFVLSHLTEDQGDVVAKEDMLRVYLEWGGSTNIPLNHIYPSLITIIYDADNEETRQLAFNDKYPRFFSYSIGRESWNSIREIQGRGGSRRRSVILPSRIKRKRKGRSVNIKN
jgi:ankyrin repeat protein